MATAVQQSNVRLQGTLATILQAERYELVEQVQNATSATTHKQPGVVDTKVIDSPGKFDEQPMKRADRLFKLRSYLGAVDQRNELALTTSEESSTPRLNGALSTLMYYILVMTKTLCRCHHANEGFAGWRQFVMEWEPRFVGLLRNVLSCRRKDDIPTQLPADEGLARESIVGACERRHHDKCACAEDGGRASQGAPHREKHTDRELDTDAKGNKSSRPREHNSMLRAILCQRRPKSKGKDKDGKDAKN